MYILYNILSLLPKVILAAATSSAAVGCGRFPKFHRYVYECYVCVYIYTYIHMHRTSPVANQLNRTPPTPTRAPDTVDFRNFIVFFWAETLAH